MLHNLCFIFHKLRFISQDFPLKYIRKFAKKRLLVTSCLSVCNSLSLHWTTWLPLDGYLWKFVFENFSKIYQEYLRFHYILTRITCTLHTAVRTFMVVLYGILRKMRNFSDQICGESQNTYFIFNNILEIMSFVIQYWKMWKSHTGNRWQQRLHEPFPVLRLYISCLYKLPNNTHVFLKLCTKI